MFITKEDLERFTIYGPERFVNATVNGTYESEMLFANDIKERLNILLMREKVDATVSIEEAQVQNKVIHPLIRISNPSHGDIGVLINKNIIIGLRLKDGRVTQLVLQQEMLRNEANGYENVAHMNYSTGDGCGCLGGIMNDNAAKRSQQAADSITYDPTELLVEEGWKKDVLHCLSQIGDDRLFEK